MLPVNVPSIRLRSANVLVTTIISNATQSNGVPIMVIIPSLVLCRPLLTDNARTANLITKAVKKTDHVPVANPVMSTPVLRDACMQRQTVVLMTILTVNAVPHHLLPAALPIIPSTVMLPAALPVPIPAVTPVIVVVPTNAHVVPRTIQALKPEQLNADQHAVTAIHLAPGEAHLIPVPLFLTMNAATHVVLVLLLVLPEHHRQIPEAAAVRQQMNAERKLVIILINLVTRIVTLVHPVIQLLAADLIMSIRHVLAVHLAARNAMNVLQAVVEVLAEVPETHALFINLAQLNVRASPTQQLTVKQIMPRLIG